MINSAETERETIMTVEERLNAIELKLGMVEPELTRFETTKIGQTWELKNNFCLCDVIAISDKELVLKIDTGYFLCRTNATWNKENCELVSEPPPKTFASLGLEYGTMVTLKNGGRFRIGGIVSIGGRNHDLTDNMEITND